MLQDIRDKTQGVIAKIIVGLIVAVFALWGVESIIGGFITSPAIAEINGEEVTEQQLTVATQNLLASIGGNIEGFDQGLLEQIALQQLVDEILIKQAAQDNAMGISENRIDRAILENPGFQVNGVYNQDIAQRSITAQGMNVPLYRENLRSQMMLSQIANAYSSTNFVTEAELERIAAMGRQTRDFRFISLTLGTRTLGEAIPDAEIESYYQANQDEFTIEEMISVQYVELNIETIMDELEVDEAVVLQQYNDEREAYEGSAERRASHILFEVGPALSEEEALAQATAARARLDQGEDFAALALELSSDVISAEEGGDIGYSDGSAFPLPIEDALLELEVDEVSDPVLTEFGVHLVMLTEDAVNEFASFEEVSERIIRDMKSAQAGLIYAQRLEDLSNMAFESSDLQSISEQLNLTIMESEMFPRSGGSGLMANVSVLAEAFSNEVLENGFNSDVVEINDTQAIVLRLLDRQEAQVRPLEEVEGEIAVVLRTELERERAQELGQEILQQLQAGNDISELLAENEVAWIEQNGTTRDSVAINSEITSAVFAMQRPTDGQPHYEGIGLSNGTYIVVELNSVNAGDLADLSDQEKNSIIQQLMSDKGQSGYRALLDSLRESADISTNLLDAEPVL